MFEQLVSAEMRFEQMGARLSDGDLLKDPTAYASFMKEYKALEGIVEKYREYCRLVSAEAEALELMQSGDDEMKMLAKDELRLVKEQLPTVTNELQILLLPKAVMEAKKWSCIPLCGQNRWRRTRYS